MTNIILELCKTVKGIIIGTVIYFCIALDVAILEMSSRQVQRLLGTDGAAKSDEFSETFQTAFDPTPSFRKIMLQILDNGYGRIYARRYEGPIV